MLGGSAGERVVTHRAFGEFLGGAEQIRVATPAIAAPINGATQNTHSCAGAPSALKKATPVERAGFTEVLEIGIEIRWISVSVNPIDSPAKPLGARSSVEPRMTKRNTKVSRTSAISTATSE